MKIVISDADFSKLKPTTRADLIALLLNSTSTPPVDQPEGFEWDDVVDLTPEQVDEFMQGCAPQTVAGLRVIAEHGPVIIADLLQKAGIENYSHFQGRVTKRTRTVTGNKHAYLFSWDDWYDGENAERGFGHYAVTEATFRSLRSHFKLD